jgi:hypothetical protein
VLFPPPVLRLQSTMFVLASCALGHRSVWQRQLVLSVCAPLVSFKMPTPASHPVPAPSPVLPAKSATSSTSQLANVSVRDQCSSRTPLTPLSASVVQGSQVRTALSPLIPVPASPAPATKCAFHPQRQQQEEQQQLTSVCALQGWKGTPATGVPVPTLSVPLEPCV